MKYKTLYCTDLDKTLFAPVGTYEEDGDLAKFVSDNTFWNNLWTKKLPCKDTCNHFYDTGYAYVVIVTSREKKWWLPLLLWLRGVKYHQLIEREVGNTTATEDLKYFQLAMLIDSQSGIFRGCEKIFMDDFKPNRDKAQLLGFSAYDADKFNRW